MTTTPLRITEDGKLVIDINGELIDMLDERFKDCHTDDGSNISKYYKLKDKINC